MAPAKDRLRLTVGWSETMHAPSSMLLKPGSIPSTCLLWESRWVRALRCSPLPSSRVLRRWWPRHRSPAFARLLMTTPGSGGILGWEKPGSLRERGRPTSASGRWRHRRFSLCACREEQHLRRHILTTRESGAWLQPSPGILGKPENPPAIRCGRSSSTFPERARFFPAKDTAGARRSHKKPREGWRTMPRRPPPQYAARRQRTAAQCPHPSTLPKQTGAWDAPWLQEHRRWRVHRFAPANRRSPSVLRWRHARESPS